jgi:hypothetical protein
VARSLALSLSLNNAFNAMPPADHSQPGEAIAPYSTQNYNVYGREFFLQATYTPGRK